jgi:signal transduction histidine kinase
VRLRTTAAAVVVVAVALLLGAVLLVSQLRDSLRDGVETTAEQRASELADQIERSGLPAAPPAEDDESDPDDADDPDEVVWQVRDESGSVVRSSQPLARPLPAEDTETSLPGSDHRYLVVTEAADDDGDHEVVVAVSLEEVEDSTEALVPLLLVGLPLVLLVVGATTWLVVTWALRPVERIRREVDEITGDRLDRRVPEPRSRDEIHRLALTMNRMLERLEAARHRQQQFVGDASHELRSPLAGIRQTAEVARAHPGVLPEGELADAVLEETDRMQRMVEQLLLLTRADEGAVTTQPREVDLDDLLLSEATRVRRAGLTVDTSNVGAARVRGDAAALGQVVRNLVDNAIRHANRTVLLASGTRDGEAWLTVEDDGPGVPTGERERIFERFVRLDEARARDAGGSGLGLAIVEEIARIHGGSVAVSDSLLGGARFVVRLPAEAALAT